MKILSDLPRNARYCTAVEPLWSVFGGMIIFYVPLYMDEIGLSGVEMGIINTVNMLIAFICHFFAGPITDRLGRKRTTLVFDLISWSIPMLIWAIAQNFWFFLVAASINAFVKIINVAWFCLFIEDTPNEKRSKALGIFYLIVYTSGIFTPITGIFISKYGTIATMRVVYLIGMVCMTSMFFLRNHLVTETKAGREIMAGHEGITMLESLRRYIKIIVVVFKNKNILLILLIYIISNFVLSMNFFQSLYLKENMGFGTISISITQGVNAVANILLYLIVFPRLAKHTEERMLAIAIAISLAGAALFLLMPGNSIAMMFIAVAVLGMGNFSTQTYRETVFMNMIGEHEKADAYGAVQTITALTCVPAGYIGGLAYSIGPKIPFMIIAFLFTLALATALFLNHRCTTQKEKILLETALKTDFMIE